VEISLKERFLLLRESTRLMQRVANKERRRLPDLVEKEDGNAGGGLGREGGRALSPAQEPESHRWEKPETYFTSTTRWGGGKLRARELQGKEGKGGTR